MFHTLVSLYFLLLLGSDRPAFSGTRNPGCFGQARLRHTHPSAACH
jgi:hypothetical protein